MGNTATTSALIPAFRRPQHRRPPPRPPINTAASPASPPLPICPRDRRRTQILALHHTDQHHRCRYSRRAHRPLTPTSAPPPPHHPMPPRQTTGAVTQSCAITNPFVDKMHSCWGDVHSKHIQVYGLLLKLFETFKSKDAADLIQGPVVQCGTHIRTNRSVCSMGDTEIVHCDTVRPVDRLYSDRRDP